MVAAPNPYSEPALVLMWVDVDYLVFNSTDAP